MKSNQNLIQPKASEPLCSPIGVLVEEKLLVREGKFKAPLQKHGFNETALGAYDLRDWDEIRNWTKELAKIA